MLEKKPLRVSIVQPALPHYRFSLFENLSMIADLEVTVWAPVQGGQREFHKVRTDGNFATRDGVVRRLGPFFLQTASIRAALAADVLVLSLNIRFLDIVIAAMIARWRKRPVVFWGHGRTRPDVTWSTWIRDRVARLGDAYVFYNEIEATDFKRRVPFKGGVVVVRNPLDTDAASTALAANKYKAPVAKNRVLVIARLFKAKKVDMLIRALSKVSRHHSAVGLAVVGDGPELVNLKKICGEEGITDRVTFYGAVHDDEVIASIAEDCAMLCLPESAGLSILHGMAHGLPVLLNDNFAANGPEYELLAPGSNGLAFRQGDVDDLAEKVGLFLSDSDLQAQLAAGAISTIQSGLYTTKAAAKSFHDAIAEASQKGGNLA